MLFGDLRVSTHRLTEALSGKKDPAGLWDPWNGTVLLGSYKVQLVLHHVLTLSKSEEHLHVICVGKLTSTI